MAILTAYPTTIDSISRYLVKNNVPHEKVRTTIFLESIPAKCLASIKAMYWLSEFEHPLLNHYMGY